MVAKPKRIDEPICRTTRSAYGRKLKVARKGISIVDNNGTISTNGNKLEQMEKLQSSPGWSARKQSTRW
jgi:hypothetical protein